MFFQQTICSEVGEEMNFIIPCLNSAADNDDDDEDVEVGDTLLSPL